MTPQEKETILGTMDRFDSYIPPHMREGLMLYITHAIEPGSFMTSVLCNDLKRAVECADHININNIPNYIHWLVNYAPPECYGSLEAVKNWKGTSQELKSDQDPEGASKNLILNGIETPDGTRIFSRTRHDYVTHLDKNGKTYMVDGGLDYARRSANGDEKPLYLFDDEPHDIQRETLDWGTYGINGDQELSYVLIMDMETSHIKAVLDECNPTEVLKNCMKKELELRG